MTVIVNPANATSAETTLRGVQEAARAIGLQINVLNTTTSREIDAAFTVLARERPDALFVAGDGFFTGRTVQFATLSMRERIPTAYAQRDYVTVGGLMSYGTDFAEMFHQVGVYAGSILKGARPALSAGRRLRRPHSQRRETSRPSGRAADQVRAGDQLQDCEGAWPRYLGETACALPTR
jgi:ABC-type uncharacterized transport system substrate-binding protein